MIMNRMKRGLILVLAFMLMMSSAVYAAPVHKDIFTEVSSENIYRHIVELTRNDTDNSRVTGFPGELAAANYIAKQFEACGLGVEWSEFPVLAFLSHGADVIVNGESLEATTFTFTPSTPEGGLNADIVYCGLGLPEDFTDKDVNGKIALIKRGDITFFEKTQNAAAAGAAGVIIFNRDDADEMINGTLGEPTDIPAVALSGIDGRSLAAAIEDGDVQEVTMIADTEMEESSSQNVIGTLKAARGNKAAKTIVIGAHYDGVDVPAANDNASGTATMMEIARVLSSQKLAYNIKFMAFGAEEIGLVGSEQYVTSLTDEELNNIVAMINMDMVGIGDTVGVMTLEEEADSFVADLAEVYLNKFGFEYERSTSSSSDHANFEAAGIPSVFLNYGPDPYYHTDDDTLNKIEWDKLYNMATLVTAMTYDMAKTPMPEAYNGLKAKANKYHFINEELPEE